MSGWETDSVSEVAQNCCVAIRLDAQSEACVQFSQIYPVVCVPSSFFIGENGVPLEVIAGSVTEDELQRRILRVTQVSTHTDADPGDRRISGTELTEGLFMMYLFLFIFFCRLTKKLEERREQKKKAEEENELKKEVERRKTGKEMLDFKRQQEEEKTKRLLEERNREKAEERAARERVKQQIALDRADRAARYAQSQQDAEAARLAALQARDAKRDAAQRERSAVARIQFRLPDGSSFTNQFPSETRLLEARQFAAQEVGNRYGQFSLATMFPRREFTAEDLEKSLLELDLAPSASIVLLPSSRPSNTVVHSSAGGGVWAMLGSLLYPLLAVWRFISGFLFSSPPPPAAAQNQPTTNTYGSSAAAEPQRDAVRKRVHEKRPEDFKKEGKIYRLRTQEDNEDDNNTWNGNSTQQM
uniref:UBX domain-containing protein 4 n=1 Tax=Cyprinus carpio TaxID=7962 RepID=A0A8C2D0G9_CYPCA